MANASHVFRRARTELYSLWCVTEGVPLHPGPLLSLSVPSPAVHQEATAALCPLPDGVRTQEESDVIEDPHWRPSREGHELQELQAPLKDSLMEVADVWAAGLESIFNVAGYVEN